MPSKLLVAAAEAAQAVRAAAHFGLRCDGPAVDGRAVMARVQRRRDSFVAGMLDDLDRLAVGAERGPRREQHRGRGRHAEQGDQRHGEPLERADRAEHRPVIRRRGQRPERDGAADGVAR